MTRLMMDMTKILLIWICIMISLNNIYVHGQNHVASSWDFNTGSDGWAQSTSAALNAEIMIRGGDLRGSVLDRNSGIAPHIDSPLMRIDIDDKYVVAIRIKVGTSTAVTPTVALRLYDDNLQMDFQGLPVDFGGAGSRTLAVPFTPVAPDGEYHVVYAPIYKYIQGELIQLRILPFGNSIDSWSTFEIDWIRLIKMPTIDKVEGCINKYMDVRPTLTDLTKRELDDYLVNRGGTTAGYANITSILSPSNDDNHYSFHTTTGVIADAPYGLTYNCPGEGGVRIRLYGRNLGHTTSITQTSLDTIWVDSRPCTDVVTLKDETVVECTLPVVGNISELANITIVQPDYRALGDTKNYLSYAIVAPRIDTPEISNIASHALDLSWTPTKNMWDAITVTGYQIQVFICTLEYSDIEATDSELLSIPDAFAFDSMIIVANVTSTTIPNLLPSRKYRFTIQALVENQANATWKDADLYGRRIKVDGALENAPSLPTEIVTTLWHDISFSFFNGNATLDHGAVDSRSSTGPSNQIDGEGSFGLNLAGTAQIENCNSSSVCCDDANCNLVCASVDSSSQDISSTLLLLNEVRSNRPENLNGWEVRPPTQDESTENLPKCGGALRLTGSHSNSAGSAWYARKMNVNEGFVTEFQLGISNPSETCRVMDDVSTHCRSRGGDGFAFVIQNESPYALGSSGDGLGFAGITNALAIEFDTYYNHENSEPYENHVAVLTRGVNASSSSHAYALASASNIPDLAEDSVHVKIVYRPVASHEHFLSDSFSVTTYATEFMSRKWMGDPTSIQTPAVPSSVAWHGGIGILNVYVNHMHKPALTTVLNLGYTLNLESGRAYVGFTASTGDANWQVHDITSWTFDSLRETDLEEDTTFVL